MDIPRLHKETEIYKQGAIAGGIADAKQKAESFITEVTDDGIWVTPSDAKPNAQGQATSSTSGWHIGGALELVREGVSVIRQWTEDGVAKVRVGIESAGHLLLQSYSMSIRHGSDRLFEVSATGQMTSMYMGGSTKAVGCGYTNAFVDEMVAWLNANGCYLSGGKVLTSTGADTGLTTYTHAGGSLAPCDTYVAGTTYDVCDADGSMFDSGRYAGIFALQDSGTLDWAFSGNTRLSPLAEVSATPAHVEAGGAAVDASGGHVKVEANSYEFDGTCSFTMDDDVYLTVNDDNGYMKVQAEIDNATGDVTLNGVRKFVVSKDGLSNDYAEIGKDSNNRRFIHLSNGLTNESYLFSDHLTTPKVYFNTDGHAGLQITGEGVCSDSVWSCFDHGSVGQSISVPANGYKDHKVSFNVGYASAPHVVATLFSTSTAAGFAALTLTITEITSSDFTVRIFNDSSTSRSPGIQWMAMGKHI